MVDRLPFLAKPPATVLHWWADLDFNTATLQAACGQAQITQVTQGHSGLSLMGRRADPAPTDAPLPKSSVWQRLRNAWAPDLTATPARANTAWPRVDAAEVPAGQSSMVWSVAVLDKVADPDAMLKAWHQALAVEGVVMFATLGPDTLKELRALYQRLGFGPSGAELIDMHDWGDALIRSGFTNPVMDQEQLKLSWASAASLLEELRQLGGNLAAHRHAGLRTPRWRQRLLDGLTDLAAPDGRITLTFEVVYGHAFKPVPRVVGPDGQPAVSLDALRATLPSRQ
jgi:malonyl-CoA O-methyltransferase